MRIERGAVTERTVKEAAAAGARLVLAPGAVLTPLAREKARALGIEIERERQMLRATVTGSVWATRRLDALPSGALLEVSTDDGAKLIAFDVLGSGVGERVLVATGSVASALLRPGAPAARRTDHRLARRARQADHERQEEQS